MIRYFRRYAFFLFFLSGLFFFFYPVLSFPDVFYSAFYTGLYTGPVLSSFLFLFSSLFFFYLLLFPRRYDALSSFLVLCRRQRHLLSVKREVCRSDGGRERWQRPVCLSRWNENGSGSPVPAAASVLFLSPW